MKKTLLLFSAIFLLLSDFIIAGTITWNVAPGSNDWNTAFNWTPQRVPNRLSDIANFGASSITAISISRSIDVAELVFNPGASSYTITIGDTGSIYFRRRIGGAGIINNSGVAQTLVNDANASGAIGNTVFINSASAGDAYIINMGAGSAGFPGQTEFNDSSTAANSVIVNRVGRGGTLFGGFSTAAEAVITNEGPTAVGEYGGGTGFANHANAGTSRIIAQGGPNRTAGAYIAFADQSSAADASLFALGPPTNNGNAFIIFAENSSGGNAHVEVSGAGELDITYHRPPGVTIGSLEGDGQVFLGGNNLSIGSNNLSTTFRGIISDRGSLTKVGGGTLTLESANSYAGGTTIKRGVLLVTNTSGSATGRGPVNIEGGALAGTGIIGKTVTVGTGTDLATLAPGREGIGTLTIEGAVIFAANASCDFALNSSLVSSDKVIADGVTIDGGVFSPVDKSNALLPAGTEFTAIDNTSATPIAGAFDNLADGATVTIANNTFQANYEGGDGNDLTLTVQ